MQNEYLYNIYINFNFKQQKTFITHDRSEILIITVMQSMKTTNKQMIFLLHDKKILIFFKKKKFSS